MAGLFNEFDPLLALPANQYGVGNSPLLTRGTLVSFGYPQSYAKEPYVIHDARPMVILTDVWPQYIRGVNLHYLDFKYVRWLLTKFGGSPSFTYSSIGFDREYMARAFRVYNRLGVRQPKKLDSEWLKKVLTEVRSFDPGEVEKIRTNIRNQIRARLQAKAEELNSYEEWRRGVNAAQRRQLADRVSGVEQAILGGQQRGLVMPPPEDGLEEEQ